MELPKPAKVLIMHRSTLGLEPGQIDQIAQQAQVVRASEGQEVHPPDQTPDALTLVITGNLSMSLVLPTGRDRTIQYLGRDDHFGLLTMLQGEPVPLRVVANQRSLLVRIPVESAVRLMREIPLWGHNLLRALGPKIRDSFLGEKRQRRPRIVGLIHASEKSRHVTSLLMEQLDFLGEAIGLVSDHDPALAIEPARSASLIDGDGSPLAAHRFRDLVGSWTETNRVFVDASLQTAESRIAEMTSSCDTTYWFCDRTSIKVVTDRLRDLISRSPRFRDKISIVHLLDRDQQVAPRSVDVAEVCRRDFKLHWDGCSCVDSPICTQQAGLNRIIHDLRGVCVGLALGGGAARGMAHLGVLQVLEEAGITVDRMSGTSAGSLTGIVAAAGYSADFSTDSFATDLKPGWPYRVLPYGDAWYVLLKYRFGGWDRMLRKYLFDWRLEQLAIPFSAVAVDLVLADPVVRQTGDAVHAILESINLPGIARPICRDGQALVDGGILDVVPADVLVDQGSNLVVSSDVSANIAFRFAGITPNTPPDEIRRPGGIAALVRSRTVQDRNIRAIGGGAADIIIEPDVSDVQLTDFKHAAEIARLGRQAAETALPEIRHTLHEMDPQLFPR